MKGIKQIKSYRLTREIGKGTAGTVFEAIDEKTNKLVAVKSIQSLKLKDKRVMENFKRELKLLHGLNHNNIIKITGVEKTVNNIYLILEYCNGGNLYEYLHFYKKTYGKPLPEENVQVILRQLIDGLEYMHNCRTIHRDIKLENILVNFNSVINEAKSGGSTNFKIEYSEMDLLDITVKIADLGYARELEGAGVASTMCGTPITMAPDIIGLFNTNNLNKDNKYNSKVDLWSLGAITYELIVGRPVFISNNVKQLFEEIMSGKYTIPPNLKISLEAISFINGLLQFYPDKRMNWNQIRNHPFIVNDINNFNLIDLTSVEDNMVDTKDCENFLWILYKTNFANNIKIDKIDNEIYESKLHESVHPRKIIENKVEPSPNIKGFDGNNPDRNLIINKNAQNEGTCPIKNDTNSREENKKDESVEVYEEANDEICIGDDEPMKVEENKDLKDIKNEIEEVDNQAESRKKEVVEDPKGNKIFGKLMSEMEQELKSSKSNSKLSNPELQAKIKEIKCEEIETQPLVEITRESPHALESPQILSNQDRVKLEEEHHEEKLEINELNLNRNPLLIAVEEDKILIPNVQDDNKRNDSFYHCGTNIANENKNTKNELAKDNDIIKSNQHQVVELERNYNYQDEQYCQDDVTSNKIESKENTDLNIHDQKFEETEKATVKEIIPSPSTNQGQMRDSSPTEIKRESNLLQLDSISDERISANYKENCKNEKFKFNLVTISLQKSLSNDYVDVRESEEKTGEKEEEDSDNLWEVISTTSVPNDDILVKVENYGFDLIPEYF